MPLAEGNHIFHKLKERTVLFKKSPVQPGDGIILQYGLLFPYLVSPNSSPERNIGVPRLQSRTAKAFSIMRFLRARTAGSSVSPSTPQFQLLVVIGAVRILPSIGLIMLDVIRIQVVQSKPIVAGQKVDRSIAPAPLRRVQIRGTCDPSGGGTKQIAVSF